MAFRAHSTTVSAARSILSSIDDEMVGQYQSGFYHSIDLWELVKSSLFITTPEEGGEPVSDEEVLDTIRALSTELQSLEWFITSTPEDEVDEELDFDLEGDQI